MSTEILIVGGYGRVGTHLAHALQNRGYGVIVAGRSEASAAKAAARLGCRHATIDLEQPHTWEAAASTCDLVACCMDQVETHFVRWVLETGRDYVDITASDEFYRAVEALDSTAIRTGASATLSVGLAPGMTNLLVKAAATRLDACSDARIGLFLGLGERHGNAAIRWFLDSFSQTGNRTVLEKVRFPNLPSASWAAPLDIADQHVVQRTLGLPAARTLVTVESSRWTRTAVKLGPALKLRGLRWLVEYLALRAHFGSEAWALAIEVSGTRGGKSQVSRATLNGKIEAESTAMIAARVIELLPSRRRPGVHHIEQIFDVSEICSILDNRPVLTLTSA
ncbi:MAG: saccharopine dehydrogenase NADP-binding domain-containing protein [Polyangiaceae bacterium]